AYAGKEYIIQVAAKDNEIGTWSDWSVAVHATPWTEEPKHLTTEAQGADCKVAAHFEVSASRVAEIAIEFCLSIEHVLLRKTVQLGDYRKLLTWRLLSDAKSHLQVASGFMIKYPTKYAIALFNQSPLSDIVLGVLPVAEKEGTPQWEPSPEAATSLLPQWGEEHPSAESSRAAPSGVGPSEPPQSTGNLKPLEKQEQETQSEEPGKASSPHPQMWSPTKSLSKLTVRILAQNTFGNCKGPRASICCPDQGTYEQDGALI
ncbi:hypothetical protein JD844_008053, partial [Phrynosoma platyrhinos]